MIVSAGAVAGTYLVVHLNEHSDMCLRYGYPKATQGADMAWYCVKRENGTDQVVPLEQLKVSPVIKSTARPGMKLI